MFVLLLLWNFSTVFLHFGVHSHFSDFFLFRDVFFSRLFLFILFLEGEVREEDNNRSCSSSNRGKQWLWHQHSTKNDNKNSFAATWILVNCRWHTFLSNWVTRFHVMPLCEYTRTFVCTEVCVRLKENVCVSLCPLLFATEIGTF